MSPSELMAWKDKALQLVEALEAANYCVAMSTASEDSHAEYLDYVVNRVNARSALGQHFSLLQTTT